MFRPRCIPLFFISAILIFSGFQTWAQEGPRTGARPKPQARRPQTRPTETPTDRWMTFTGPDGDFSVSFPVRPTPETLRPDMQGPVTAIRAYDAATDWVHFHINFQDYGGDPDSPEANSFGGSAYEQEMARGLRGDGVLVISARRLAPNISELEFWAPATHPPYKKLHSLVRDIIYRGRGYHMSCGSRIQGEEVDRQACRRFFNSFRLTRKATAAMGDAPINKY
jgi:hypothetical protein